MAQVTVNAPTGTDKENLNAVTVGDKRWGANGQAYGTAQTVQNGNNVQFAAYYAGKKYLEGSADIDEDIIFDVVANGPDDTEFNEV